VPAVCETTIFGWCRRPVFEPLSPAHAQTNKMSGPKKYSRQEFLSIFPALVEDIKEAAAKYNLPQNAMEWLEKVRADLGNSSKY
jgi:hypothetical protein